MPAHNTHNLEPSSSTSPGLTHRRHHTPCQTPVSPPDRTSLRLPGHQADLIKALDNRTPNVPLVVVLMHGGSFDVAWMNQVPSVKGILSVPFPGQVGRLGEKKAHITRQLLQYRLCVCLPSRYAFPPRSLTCSRLPTNCATQEGGRGLANLLFGRVSPSGRLPVTWYNADYISRVSPLHLGMRPVAARNYPGRSYRWGVCRTQQGGSSKPESALSARQTAPLPPVSSPANCKHTHTHAHTHDDRFLHESNYVLYPFGYGLSYTTFGYSGMKALSARDPSCPASGPAPAVCINVTVTNMGGPGSIEFTPAAEHIVPLYLRHVATAVSELGGWVRRLFVLHP
jgi:hypothetical protein